MPPVAPQPPSQPDPLIGVNLGGYEIEELIGAGAMGRVYRARQIALDRPVAVKILPPQFAADELSIARFRREAKAAAAIQNGHIVHVHDFGDQDGVYYYVMELIQGETLGQLLAKHTRFEQSDCIEMARQVLLGLEAAHSAGIVHRDVKPDNLMLDHNGKIKVGDLGLARSFHSSADTHLTQTGMAMGTPQYVAPEQICDSSEIDYRADFYALGATLFHLSTGRPPFPARSSAEVMSRHLNDPAPRARDHNPALSESFTELIQKLMEKMAPMRPQTHAEIYQALDRCQAGTAAVPAAAKVWSPQSLHPATLPTPEPNRSRQPLIWVIAAVAAIAAGVWAYIATLPEVPTVTKTPTPEERNPTPSQETPPAKPPIPEPLTPATATKDKPAAPNLPEPEQEEKAQIVAANLPVSPGPALLSGSKPGKETVIDLGDGVEMEFVWIPPGEFTMGSPSGEKGRKADEGPIRNVTISKGFWMGKYEVSQEQYAQMTGENPSKFKGDHHPVERVSWDDGAAFCRVLTTKTGKAFRLPTEAEWEYACRAGTTTIYHAGENESDLAKAGWYKGNSGGMTHPVGKKEPNAWGLHDMHGNVWEWCWDWYGSYSSGSQADPRGPASGKRRVYRGGSWSRFDGAGYCRAARRSVNYFPGHPDAAGIGFRVARSSVP